MLFKKKNKTVASNDEFEMNKKIEQSKTDFRVQIRKLGTMQKNIVDKIVECKKKGLTAAEKSYRSSLAMCLNEIKKREEQLMQIELAQTTRELIGLNNTFVETLDQLSQQTLDAVELTDAKRIKKVHKKYLKAQYKAQEQNAQIDTLMEAGKFADVASLGAHSTEYDDQIDSLISIAEQNGGSLPIEAVALSTEAPAQQEEVKQEEVKQEGLKE